MPFLLSPYAFVAVPLFVVAVASTLYLLRTKDKSSAAWYLTGAVACVALGMLAMFLNAVVLWGNALWPAADMFATLAMGAMILFAYHLPERDRSPEFWLAAAFAATTGAIAVAYSAFYAYELLVEQPFGTLRIHDAYPFLMPLAFLGALVSAARRTIVVHRRAAGTGRRRVVEALWRPQGNHARVLRNFSLALSLGLLQGVASALAMAGVLAPPLDVYGIGLGLLAMIVAVVYASLDHMPHQPSLIVRLVGLSLVTLLAVLGAVGLQDSHTAAVASLERLAAEAEVARRAVRTNDLASLPRSVAYVMTWPRPASGGAAPDPQALRLIHARDGALGLSGVMEETRRQAQGITPPRPIWSTYAEVLSLTSSRAGSLRYHYGANPPGSYHQYIAYGLAEGQTEYEVGFDLLELAVPAHREALSKSIAVVVSSLFILTVFPLFFRAGITRPLDRLLAGVRRANAGDLSVDVPVIFDDEIGYLTRSFNDMVGSIRGEIEERKRAEDMAHRRAAALEAIAEVGGLVTAGADQHVTLDTLSRKIAEVTAFEAAGVGLFDAKRQELTFHAFASAPAIFGLVRRRTTMKTRPEDSPALQEMLRELKPIFFDDPRSDPRIRESIRALAREGGIRGAASYPLIYGETLIGRLDLWSTRPLDLSPDDLALLSTLADQAAAVAQNARLYDQVRALNVTLEQRVVDRTRELTALYEVSAVANRADTVEALLDESLARTAEALGCEIGTVFTCDPADGGAEPNRLRLAAHRGIAPGALSAMTASPTDHPLLIEVIAGGVPVLIPNLAADARVPEGMRRGSGGALLLAPLRAEREVLGVMGLVRERAFSVEDVALLASIADQVGLAVHSDQLRKQSIVLEERARLARDLHDSVTQLLYGQVVLTEAGLVGLEAGAVDSVGNTLAQLGQTARRALQEMRLFIHRMRPPDLEREGLVGALHLRLEAVEGRSGMQARLTADQDLRLPVATQSALYHIAEEALNNAMRHANANRVDVRLWRQDGRVVLEIDDDGQGFDPTAVRPGGMGLANMAERARSVGGEMHIHSRPGSGTQITVAVNQES